MLRGTDNPESYMNGSCGLRRLAESSVAKSKKDHMREPYKGASHPNFFSTTHGFP